MSRGVKTRLYTIQPPGLGGRTYTLPTYIYIDMQRRAPTYIKYFNFSRAGENDTKMILLGRLDRGGGRVRSLRAEDPNAYPKTKVYYISI